MSHPWRLEEMAPTAARDRLRESGRLLVPVGALEFRAAHLPLGSDSIIVSHLADKLSSRTGVPRAPTIPVGVHSRHDVSPPGAAALSRKTLHRVMNELIAAWEEGGGVRETVILTAHTIEAHLEALSTIRALGEVRVVDVFGFEFGPLLEHPTSPIHGGELETSLLMHIAPGLLSARVEAAPGASAARGAALCEYILEQVDARWLRHPPL